MLTYDDNFAEEYDCTCGTAGDLEGLVAIKEN